MPSKLNDAIGSSSFGGSDYERSMQLYKQMVDGQEKYAMASARKVAEVQRNLYGENAKIDKQQRQRAIDIAIKYEEELSKTRSAGSRKEFAEKRKQAIQEYEEELKRIEALRIAQIKASDSSVKQKTALEKQVRDKTAEEEKKLAAEKEKNAKTLEKYDKLEYDRLSKKDKIAYKLQKAQEKTAEKQKKADEAAVARQEAEEKFKAKQATQEELDAARAKDAEAQSELASSKAEEKLAQNASFNQKMMENIQKSIANIAGKLVDEVSQSVDIITQNQSRISTRLLGSSNSYRNIQWTLSRNLAMSPLVSQKAVYENLAKMIDSGIAYNVEQRAFLATISDKIATTFDAFDSNLTRLIRLQQADITSARLGIEATLTNQLNSMFSDTSYLSDMYKTVSSALVDAESQMTREQAAEFEYTVQKYLGSLYSLGLSESAVSTIATGIGYLGTGNIEALSSNASLMNLFGMGAARAGRDIGSVLTGGATAEDANKILKGIIEYLREIATSTNNMAVKSAYGSTFGLGVSDLRALANLTDADISNLYSSSMTYSSAVRTTKNLMTSAITRISLPEMLENVFSNMMFATGQSLASTPQLYLPFMLAGEIKKLTGGTEIPEIAGFKVGSTVEGLLQTALMAPAFLNALPNMLMSLASGGGVFGAGLNTAWWNASDFTTRGKNWTGITGGSDTGVTMSTYIAGESGDIQDAVLKRATQQAKQQAGETDTIDITTLYNALFGTNGADRKPVLVEINGVSAGVSVPTTITETENNPIFVKESI